MLRKITLFRFLLVSLILFGASFIYQLSRGQDCAWDGCYPTNHPTLYGALGGLPGLVLEIIIAIGIFVGLAKRKIAKQTKDASR